MISGQNVAELGSMTYSLSRHWRKLTPDQWTECPRTGIDDLQPVEEANTRSVSRMLQDSR